MAFCTAHRQRLLSYKATCVEFYRCTCSVQSITYFTRLVYCRQRLKPNTHSYNDNFHRHRKHTSRTEYYHAVVLTGCNMDLRYYYPMILYCTRHCFFVFCLATHGLSNSVIHAIQRKARLIHSWTISVPSPSYEVVGSWPVYYSRTWYDDRDSQLVRGSRVTRFQSQTVGKCMQSDRTISHPYTGHQNTLSWITTERSEQ